jgi:hypothetical protein
MDRHGCSCALTMTDFIPWRYLRSATTCVIREGLGVCWCAEAQTGVMRGSVLEYTGHYVMEKTMHFVNRQEQCHCQAFRIVPRATAIGREFNELGSSLEII